ncbi:exodeoxyribonuclease VII small subunit [Helicobacter sp.]|uniref:exodeoxyribonuclease VII small subunit n=1 Tax=Helicobacter sp. TaxID=218 RepID=UPI0025BB95DF|nr:exodeoxyribonuclease VII small subunit [Helicobacter sp.]MBR2494900.1 exodeoxyribonuclease VII small subunit [Helicobacter sp.]
MEHFEDKIKKTKEILQKLNAQDLSLKESLEFYKQGMQELKNAQDLLEKAKLEYEEIKASDNSSSQAEAES